MNVYDFDNTIFIPDSSVCFILFCLRHYTRAVLKALPSSALETIPYLVRGRKDAKHLKQALFSFLNRVDSVDAIVSDFWEQYSGNLEPWYLEQKRDDDVIISASPEFLLRPITERLGVRLVATQMNPYTGEIRGRNCHDEEKVRRFLELWPADSVDAFYSDSLYDTPMARLAKQAFLVQDGRFLPWP